MNLIFCAALLSSSCVPSFPTAQAQSPSQNQGGSSVTALSSSQKARLGRKIWQNESAGTKDGLTAWNVGEEFPSLGIGHFIWYPKNYNGPFTESFPAFILFARAQGVQNIPAVALQADCPWSSRFRFQQDFRGEALTSLRDWLSRTVPLQTDFIIAKSQASFQKIINQAPPAQRNKIIHHYRLLSGSTHGTYALIDYVNFKGEGTNPKERYQGQGWGLQQVLAEMRPVANRQQAPVEFSQAAKRVLDRRIQNSPASRGEKRWRAGWHNRCSTYAVPF